MHAYPKGSREELPIYKNQDRSEIGYARTLLPGVVNNGMLCPTISPGATFFSSEREAYDQLRYCGIDKSELRVVELELIVVDVSSRRWADVEADAKKAELRELIAEKQKELEALGG